MAKGKKTIEDKFNKQQQEIQLLKKELAGLQKKFNRSQLWNFIHFAVILVPIVIGLSYAIPVVKELFSVYDKIFTLYPQLESVIDPVKGF